MAIDEEVGRVAEKITSRQMARASLDLIIQVAWLELATEDIRKLGVWMWYADARRSRIKRDSPRRIPVDVDAMVEKWLTVIVGLSTAHDHASYTAADYQTDELISPMLTAPIKQIRDFTSKLATRLREDPRVPFLIWSGFQRLVEPVVLKGKDGDVLALKTQLATEIAQMVERDLDRAQLVDALAGALQWRPVSDLEGVKKELQSGTRPSIKGRESCLFLEVGDARVVI